MMLSAGRPLDRHGSTESRLQFFANLSSATLGEEEHESRGMGQDYFLTWGYEGLKSYNPSSELQNPTTQIHHKYQLYKPLRNNSSKMSTHALPSHARPSVDQRDPAIRVLSLTTPLETTQALVKTLNPSGDSSWRPSQDLEYICGHGEGRLPGFLYGVLAMSVGEVDTVILKLRRACKFHSESTLKGLSRPNHDSLRKSIAEEILRIRSSNIAISGVWTVLFFLGQRLVKLSFEPHTSLTDSVETDRRLYDLQDKLAYLVGEFFVAWGTGKSEEPHDLHGKFHQASVSTVITNEYKMLASSSPTNVSGHIGRPVLRQILDLTSLGGKARQSWPVEMAMLLAFMPEAVGVKVMWRHCDEGKLLSKERVQAWEFPMEKGWVERKEIERVVAEEVQNIQEHRREGRRQQDSVDAMEMAVDDREAENEDDGEDEEYNFFAGGIF
ncbi:hypothetical protein BJ508DRAFT_378609 [Ascobolus immersus RN42]|uniref:Uncharacterized protein n=1 Tax=Ascobolus immersus RN42 TaxID=1160509 RepID=A0A3N4HZJ2_ASCIM|nr:hypothetical protein BJ508DRAFT_378609 [Ascobolus immersus RN42]